MEVLTKNSGEVTNTFEGSKAFINEMLTWFSNVWAWSDSSITESDGQLTGKFYFKENVYVQIQTVPAASNYVYLRFSFHAPSVEIVNYTNFGFTQATMYWMFSAAKGVSGFALAVTCTGVAPNVAKATNFTMFFGKCVSVNNEEKYGAVLEGHKGNGVTSYVRIADEDGTVPDNVYAIRGNTSTSYKSVLFPICNPVTGSVFKNIYEPKFCPFNHVQFTLGGHTFQAGEYVIGPCLSDE